jgi:hypothetical protein
VIKGAESSLALSADTTRPDAIEMPVRATSARTLRFMGATSGPGVSSP